MGLSVVVDEADEAVVDEDDVLLLSEELTLSEDEAVLTEDSEKTEDELLLSELLSILLTVVFAASPFSLQKPLKFPMVYGKIICGLEEFEWKKLL